MFEDISKSLKICLARDVDSNCLSECFGCNYISDDNHIESMLRDSVHAIDALNEEVERQKRVIDGLTRQLSALKF